MTTECRRVRNFGDNDDDLLCQREVFDCYSATYWNRMSNSPRNRFGLEFSTFVGGLPRAGLLGGWRSMYPDLAGFFGAVAISTATPVPPRVPSTGGFRTSTPAVITEPLIRIATLEEAVLRCVSELIPASVCSTALATQPTSTSVILRPAKSQDRDWNEDEDEEYSFEFSYEDSKRWAQPELPANIDWAAVAQAAPRVYHAAPSFQLSYDDEE